METAFTLRPLPSRLLRCAFCFAGSPGLNPCAGCGTLLHSACWSLAEACPTLGCVCAPHPSARVARARRTADQTLVSSLVTAILVVVPLLVGLALACLGSGWLVLALPLRNQKPGLYHLRGHDPAKVHQAALRALEDPSAEGDYATSARLLEQSTDNPRSTAHLPPSLQALQPERVSVSRREVRLSWGSPEGDYGLVFLRVNDDEHAQRLRDDHGNFVGYAELEPGIFSFFHSRW